MRLAVLVLSVAACSERVGPGDGASCGSAPTPGHDFCQTYVAEDSVPGSPVTIALRIHDSTITGNGRYKVSGGTSSSLIIAGVLREPYLDLALQYRDGREFQYSGRFAPDNRITGALFDSLGNATPLSFVSR